VATLVESGSEHETGVALPKVKYPQYGALLLAARPIIMVRVNRINSWRAKDYVNAENSPTLASTVTDQTED